MFNRNVISAVISLIAMAFIVAVIQKMQKDGLLDMPESESKPDDKLSFEGEPFLNRK